MSYRGAMTEEQLRDVLCRTLYAFEEALEEHGTFKHTDMIIRSRTIRAAIRKGDVSPSEVTEPLFSREDME